MQILKTSSYNKHGHMLQEMYKHESYNLSELPPTAQVSQENKKTRQTRRCIRANWFLFVSFMAI
jgi:hypothetical protein